MRGDAAQVIAPLRNFSLAEEHIVPTAPSFRQSRLSPLRRSDAVRQLAAASLLKKLEIAVAVYGALKGLRRAGPRRRAPSWRRRPSHSSSRAIAIAVAGSLVAGGLYTALRRSRR